MKRRSHSRGVFVVVFLGILIAGCTRIRILPERFFSGDPFSELYSELNTIADVERRGREELIVRFPGTTLFGLDEYALRAEGKRSLADVARILRSSPGFPVIVEGHTDNRGRESYNQWLSERRSRVVADFLVNEGLDPDKIQVVGYGESRPLATNATAEGRQRNRRVEIHVKPRQPLPNNEPPSPETDLPPTMIPTSMAA